MNNDQKASFEKYFNAEHPRTDFETEVLYAKARSLSESTWNAAIKSIAPSGNK